MWSRSAARYAPSTSINARKSRTAFTPGFEGLPVVYFTQLMAIAFGCSEQVLKLDLHHNSPRPVLAAKGLL